MKRTLAVVGCVVFLALALRMGTASLHAYSTGTPVSDWKGRTMTYQDGAKLTVAFVFFAACFCYVAVRPRGKR